MSEVNMIVVGLLQSLCVCLTVSSADEQRINTHTCTQWNRVNESSKPAAKTLTLSWSEKIEQRQHPLIWLVLSAANNVLPMLDEPCSVIASSDKLALPLMLSGFDPLVWYCETLSVFLSGFLGGAVFGAALTVVFTACFSQDVSLKTPTTTKKHENMLTC